MQETAGEMSTEYPLVPEGEWLGLSGKPAARQAPDKNDPNKKWTFLDLPWTFDDPIILKEMNRDGGTVQARFSCILELTPEGKLDTSEGKNVKLGQLRAALGLNQDGFRLADLEGHTATCQVKHETGKDDVIRSNVVAVTTS